MSADVVAGGLQLVGIGVTAWGIGVVRSWVVDTAKPTVAAVLRGLVEWWRDFLWWVRRREGSRVVFGTSHFGAGGTVSMSGSITVEPDPETQSEVERIRRLERELLRVREDLARGTASLHEAHQATAERLDTETDRLRAELRESTRSGWRWVFGGLVLQAFGTVVSMVW